MRIKERKSGLREGMRNKRIGWKTEWRRKNRMEPDTWERRGNIGRWRKGRVEDGWTLAGDGMKNDLRKKEEQKREDSKGLDIEREQHWYERREWRRGRKRKRGQRKGTNRERENRRKKGKKKEQFGPMTGWQKPGKEPRPFLKEATRETRPLKGTKGRTNSPHFGSLPNPTVAVGCHYAFLSSSGRS